METAFRMQTEAMDAFDIRKESEATRARYGEGDFARGCLIARRLMERGVRMVQVYYRSGPALGQSQRHHGSSRALAAEADRAIASLLHDLKTSGLLNDTLIIIGGEFGRTPAVRPALR